MTKEEVVLLREACATLKRIEALLRAQTEDMGIEDVATGCPKCGSEDVVEIGAVMGEDGPHMRCQKCGAKLEVVRG